MALLAAQAQEAFLQAAAMTPESTPYRTGSAEAEARVTARTQAEQAWPNYARWKAEMAISCRPVVW